MARAAGPGGILDIRSVAILEDLIFAENPCEAGSTHRRRHRYYGSEFFRDLPEDSDLRNPEKYDRSKDWIHCGCAAFICMVVLGILNSIGLLQPHVKSSYNMGSLHVTVIAAVTYAITFCFGPIAVCLVRCIGHRLTCIFGLLLFFVGLVLDALEIHIVAYYVAHMGLIGIGSCLALTAAASSVVRHFRNQLKTALTIVFIASPVGTALFHLILFTLAINTAMSYKWIVLIISFLVLACIALTHPLPSASRPSRHPNPFATKKRKQIVSECISELHQEEASSSTLPLPGNQEEEDARDSCLCVCVFDISAVTDLSFLLWAVVSSCAMITLYVPYLFLIWYAYLDFGIPLLDGLHIMLWFSLACLLTRAGVLIGGNHTFIFNRTLFQVGCIGTATMYLLLHQATTYGWLLVWSLLVGMLESIIVGVIPRLTLLTLPRRYMNCCWAYLVFFNGFALIIGPFLMVSVKQATGGDIGLACIGIGIIQIAGGILVFFIPNEEYFEEQSAALKEAEIALGTELASLSPTHVTLHN